MTRTTRSAQQRNDGEIVELFFERVDELTKTKLIESDGLKFEYRYHFDKEVGFSTYLKEPDEDNLRSYLVTFRQFISQKEPVFIGRMYNLCARLLTDDEMKHQAADGHQHWIRTQKHNGMQLVVNNHEYSASDVCDWFINGHYFHSDPAYRIKIREMEKFPPNREILRLHFLDFVIATSHHISYLRHLISWAQQEGKINLVHTNNAI